MSVLARRPISAGAVSAAQADGIAPARPATTRPQTPRRYEGCIKEAYELAIGECEPVFVPAQVHVDDRGWSIMNQLQGVLWPGGQINFSVQHPGVVKAWHRHRKQTDFWLCLAGHLKVGVHREEDGASWALVIGQMRPGVVVIPPPLWHGAATVGSEPAGLLYYVTRAFDPEQPDEERRDAGSIDGFPWAVQHR